MGISHIPRQPDYPCNRLLFLGPCILFVLLGTQEPTIWVTGLLGHVDVASGAILLPTGRQKLQEPTGVLVGKIPIKAVTLRQFRGGGGAKFRRQGQAYRVRLLLSSIEPVEYRRVAAAPHGPQQVGCC